jgi:hypothetical protein
VKIRKHISILIATLLLISNTGLAFNVHYCEGKVSSISFNYKIAEPCIDETTIVEKSCCAQENKHEDCCKNSKVNIEKSSSDNIIVKNIQIDLSSFTAVEIWKTANFTFSEEIIISNQSLNFYCDSHAPPFYKLYSQLIFYA